MMCILENFIRQQGYSYLKLDGSTSISARQPLINEFNQNSSHFIFLLTTKVGGLGVNLTGANRVVIYDPDWNPATDVQARERAWRPGQVRHVTVYRLITAGTIEEKIYHRQIFKQFLSDRVLRDPRRRRFFKSNDLYELFTLQEDGDDLGEKGAKTETSAIFAGTGSEIRMSAVIPKSKRKLSKKEILEKVEKSTERNESRKSAKQEINVIKKRKNSFDEAPSPSVSAPSNDNLTNIDAEKKIVAESTVTFSREKIEMMKRLAQNLSLKISKKLDEGGSKEDGSKKKKKEKEERKRVKKEKRRKNKKEIKFEGERVAHLVGCEQAKRNQQQNEEKVNTDQDNYVLRKLFAKSGLQTALHHDVIMEGGDADYALVEGEAERVAHEAVKALKESRRKCWAAREGIPTWTGQSGVLGGSTSKPLRFGKKKQSAALVGSSSSKTSEKQETMLSSSEILSQIRKKEGLLDYFRWKKRVKDMRANGEEGDIEETNLSSCGVSREQADLLDDIRMFVACGATQDGQATTKEILARFQDRLPSGTTPQLFKSLLKSVCNFENGENTGSGLWKLKPEFHD
ncbi:hypothetical protein J437_LFUL012127 [Ladona fulva]|uniref:DNA repair and recombination protein RAD54-like n=1 Tax=Ladona fulva TaxID=123851 RepID=A0A8K0KD20_LADFU|nr:hypothetical protein J437_LFUL012127 [Ladona fulva]